MDDLAKAPYITGMIDRGTLQNLASSLLDTVRAVPSSGLLMLTVGALLGGWIGSLMIRREVPLGRLVRAASTLVLVGLLVAVVLQMSRFDPRLELALPEVGLPKQEVAGGETRIPMARDGHFWIDAEVNGAPVRFMVDTGATLTAVSPDIATKAGLEPRVGGLPVRVNTANGTITADISSMDELRFGNIPAGGLDTVIAPGLGKTNVLGMNFLSRLKGWRVENNVMILTPNNPQPVLEQARE